jgi:hypothetical protein
LIKLD